MNVESEKSELIKWISSLKDSQILQQILLLKKKTESPESKSPREFGGGKHFFSYIADDFNEPLDDFKEYM
jgi:hypothetical protein